MAKSKQADDIRIHDDRTINTYQTTRDKMVEEIDRVISTLPAGSIVTGFDLMNDSTGAEFVVEFHRPANKQEIEQKRRSAELHTKARFDDYQRLKAEFEGKV